jgi:hypothetical protein
MMLCRVPLEMIIFVPALPGCPYVPTANAREIVRVRPSAGAHFDIDPLSRLPLVTIARWRWHRAMIVLNV